MSVAPLPHKEAVSDDIQECLDNSIAELLKERVQTYVAKTFAWRGDENSCLIVHGLRESGEVISHSCTKMSMVCSFKSVVMISVHNIGWKDGNDKLSTGH